MVQAAFQQAVARGGGRVVVMERYPLDRAQMQGPVQRVAQAARQVDAIFIPDGADSVSAIVQALNAAGVIRASSWSAPDCGSRPAHLRRTGRAGRLVRVARPVRLPRLLGPLSFALRAGSAAPGDARL